MKLFMRFSWKTPHENFKIHGWQIHENIMKYFDLWKCHEMISTVVPWKFHKKSMKNSCNTYEISAKFLSCRGLNNIQSHLIIHTWLQAMIFSSGFTCDAYAIHVWQMHDFVRWTNLAIYSSIATMVKLAMYSHTAAD